MNERDAKRDLDECNRMLSGELPIYWRWFVEAAKDYITRATTAEAQGEVLRGTIADMDKEVADLKAQLADWKDTYGSLTEYFEIMKAEKDARIAELEKALEAIEDHHLKLNARVGRPAERSHTIFLARTAREGNHHA